MVVAQANIDRYFDTSRLSESERVVLDYLVGHLALIRELGVRDVAGACFTSVATVVRLAKKLSFTGYREMSYELRRLGGTDDAERERRSLDGGYCRYTARDFQLLRDALAQPDAIGVSGEGYSHLVAEYMEKKLLGIGHMAVSQEYLEAEQFIGLAAYRLAAVLLVSKSGKTPAVLETAAACRQAAVPTIAFTGNPASALAGCADASVIIEDDQPLDIENQKHNRFTGYCILAFENLLNRAVRASQSPQADPGTAGPGPGPRNRGRG